MRGYKIIRSILIIKFLFLAIITNGQVVIDGQFRTKFEMRDGYKTLIPKGANATYLATQRTRLNFKYSWEKLITQFSIQDVRIWGDNDYKSDVPVIGVHEAWGEILLSEAFSIKIGRQELRYDDERLLSYRNWNDVGASHDLALFKYKKNSFDAHFGFAYNNQKSDNYLTSYTLNYYKAMGFLWLSKAYSNGFKISGIAIGDGYQKDNSVDTVFVRYTYGGNVSYESKESKIGYYGTFYYQSGEDNLGKTINANFFSSKFSYKISDKLSLTAGIDYFSGNDAFSDPETNNAFSKLYGIGHKYYGYMDYFTEIETHTKGGGLMDIFISAKLKFNEKSNLELAYHNFSFTNNVIDPESDPLNPVAADKQLGSELDLLYNYKYSKIIDFKFGYSTMFATKSMEIIKNGSRDRFLNWAWVMVTLNPVFYKQNDVSDKSDN
ncbi:MAG: alginate export family protein [Bacteroidales bacterium]|nr:alginate export family protein [Bacteroidales bacterium]